MKQLNNWDEKATDLFQTTLLVLRDELNRSLTEYDVGVEDWNNSARLSIVERICNIVPNWVMLEQMNSQSNEEE